MCVRLTASILAAACIAGCSKSSNPSPTPTPTPTPAPMTVTISIVPGARTMTTTAYSPNPVTVPVGSTVTWVNNDTSSHNQVADGGSFATGLVAPGGQASVTLQNRGSFPYHCGVHPNMVATLNVQ